MDPYDILGVAKNAAKETIRRAYRARAKATHPDTGGSIESFALVRRAHDCLSDDARRAHYDATGEVKEDNPDNLIGNAMQMAFGALGSVIDEAGTIGVTYHELGVVADTDRPALEDEVAEGVPDIAWARAYFRSMGDGTTSGHFGAFGAFMERVSGGSLTPAEVKEVVAQRRRSSREGTPPSPESKSRSCGKRA